MNKYLIFLLLLAFGCSKKDSDSPAPNNTLKAVATTPGKDAGGVSVDVTVSITFSDAIKASSLSSTNFSLRSTSDNALAPGSPISSGTTIAWVGSGKLKPLSRYRVEVKDVESVNGAKLNEPFSFEFTTMEVVAADTSLPSKMLIFTSCGLKEWSPMKAQTTMTDASIFLRTLVETNYNDDALYRNLAVSPNGKWVAWCPIVGSSDYRVQVLPYGAASNSEIKLKVCPFKPFTPWFMPDNRTVRFLAADGIYEFDHTQAMATSPNRIFEFPSSFLASQMRPPFVWSPDGKKLAVTLVGVADRNVWVIDADNKTVSQASWSYALEKTYAASVGIVSMPSDEVTAISASPNEWYRPLGWLPGSRVWYYTNKNTSIYRPPMNEPILRVDLDANALAKSDFEMANFSTKQAREFETADGKFYTLVNKDGVPKITFLRSADGVILDQLSNGLSSTCQVKYVCWVK